MVPFYKTQAQPMLKHTNPVNLAILLAGQLRLFRAALPQASRKSDGNDFLERLAGALRLMCAPLTPGEPLSDFNVH